jgi:hypothetical protein
MAHFFCHSRENGNPDFVPAKAGNQKYMKLDSCFHGELWIPASAGMTTFLAVFLYNFQNAKLIHEHKVLLPDFFPLRF